MNAPVTLSLLEDSPQELPSEGTVSSALDSPPPQLKVLNFEEVIGAVEVLEGLRLEAEPTDCTERGVNADAADDVVSLDKVRFLDRTHAHVPGFGTLRMTDWVRRQIGGLIGVRWDRFFGPFEEKEDADAINRAVSDHLERRRDGSPKLRVIARSAQSTADDPTPIWRGAVGPKYSEVRDLTLLQNLDKAGSPIIRDFWGFSRAKLVDNASYYTLIDKEPFDLVGDLLPGDVGYIGAHFRTSEVGAYSLIMDVHVLRAVCVNGLVVVIDGKHLYRRVHRGLDVSTLPKVFSTCLDGAMAHRDTMVDLNKRLFRRKPSNPAREITDFLSSQRVPKVLQKTALNSYNEDEQLQSYGSYGILQALTRVSARLGSLPAKQQEIESLAWKYAESIAKAA